MNGRGRIESRYLSKAIAKPGFYTFKLCLTNECKKRGIELRQVDRSFLSSKSCSLCGVVKVHLSVSEWFYRYESCGFEERDLSAAKKLDTLKSIQYSLIGVVYYVRGRPRSLRLWSVIANESS